MEMTQELVSLVSNVNTMGNNPLGPEKEYTETANHQGGIAIGCCTASNIVEMGGYIQSLSFGMTSVESTDSGILIHSTDDENGEEQQRQNWIRTENREG